MREADRWLTAGEAAEMIGCGVSTMWDRVKKRLPGYPRPYRLGPRETKFRESEVSRYIESCRVE
jgi:predicted DNA-binding transcriptional regulator AlpA